jgi:hypothetical protein
MIKKDDCGKTRVVEKRDRERPKIRGGIGAGFGPLKFIMRADLFICFIIIPLGIFIGWFFSVNPFLTIPLVGIIAVMVIACMAATRYWGSS